MNLSPDLCFPCSAHARKKGQVFPYSFPSVEPATFRVTSECSTLMPHRPHSCTYMFLVTNNMLSYFSLHTRAAKTLEHRPDWRRRRCEIHRQPTSATDLESHVSVVYEYIKYKLVSVNFKLNKFNMQIQC